jgi:hypothetical protein
MTLPNFKAGVASLRRAFLLGAPGLGLAVALLFTQQGTAFADDGCHQVSTQNMGNSTQIVFSCPAGQSAPMSYVNNQYSSSHHGYDHQGNWGSYSGSNAGHSSNGNCVITSKRVIGNSTQYDFHCPAGFGPQFSYSNSGYQQSYAPHNVTYGNNFYGGSGYVNNQYTGSLGYQNGGWGVAPNYSSNQGNYNQHTCYRAGGSAYYC